MWGNVCYGFNLTFTKLMMKKVGVERPRYFWVIKFCQKLKVFFCIGVFDDKKVEFSSIKM